MASGSEAQQHSMRPFALLLAFTGCLVLAAAVPGQPSQPGQPGGEAVAEAEEKPVPAPDGLAPTPVAPPVPGAMGKKDFGKAKVWWLCV